MGIVFCCMLKYNGNYDKSAVDGRGMPRELVERTRIARINRMMPAAKLADGQANIRSIRDIRVQNKQLYHISVSLNLKGSSFFLK